MGGGEAEEATLIGAGVGPGPSPWDDVCVRHPAVAGLVLGSPTVLTLAVPPGLHRPWWSLALMVAVWLVVWPAANAFLWRDGGRRRRDYDRRLRASVGGAATLDG